MVATSYLRERKGGRVHDTGLHLRETFRSLTGLFLIFILGAFFTLQANAGTLLCSSDSIVDGNDTNCDGGGFTGGLWVYLWPEGNVHSVDFYVDGIFNKTERLAPYELGGGSQTSFSSGTHTVRAVVNLIGGGSEEVSTTFIINTAPTSYSLLCSSDSIVNGSDAGCDGGSFTGDLWVYLWPEGNVDSVDFYVDGIFNNTERLAPYELDSGSPTSFSSGTHAVRAVVNLIGGGSEEVSTTFTIGSTPTSYSLLCSSDSMVDGSDAGCDGGSFTGDLWVYLWPEGNVDSVDFYVDGIFNNTERLAPYELDAGSPTSFSSGTHAVSAVVNLIGGGSEDVNITFTIGSTPTSYSLLCSSDSIVDGNDTICDGGGFSTLTHPSGIWVYLWPEDRSAIDSVDFYMNDIFQRRENFAPWELLGGEPLVIPLSQNDYVITTNLGLFSGGSSPGPTAQFSYRTPVNDPPLAVRGCGSTRQDQTLAGTLGATGPETPTLLTYSLNADGSGGAGPVITAKGGTVTLTDPTTGAFTYQPDTTTGDKRGVDSFDYQVSDTEGGVSSATETVIVDQTIMPLGDSITMGSDFTGGTFGDPDFRVGYRKPLFDTLGISGYTFDFVGSLSDGSALLSDAEHEGHGGWTAFDIAEGQNPPNDGVFAWLDDNPADIILLHAGTNDFLNTTEFDIAGILDNIADWEISAGGNPVTVILALIIDIDQDPFNGVVTTFNNNVRAMAEDRINNPLNLAYPDDIIIVNQQNALIYPADMSDTLHPNDNGYAGMANVWLDALTNVNPNTNEAVLDKCP